MTYEIYADTVHIVRDQSSRKGSVNGAWLCLRGEFSVDDSPSQPWPSPKPEESINVGQGHTVFLNLPPIIMINDQHKASLKAKIWNTYSGNSQAFGEAQGELQFDTSRIILRDLVINLKDDSPNQYSGTIIVSFKAVKK